MLAYQITNVSRIEVQIFMQFMLFRYQGNMWIFLEMQKIASPCKRQSSMNVNVSIQRNDNLVSPVKIIACWSINMIWKQMSRRSPLCDLNVLFTGNELQLVWKTREQFWDLQLIFLAKKNGIECIFLQTNKKSAKTRGGREGIQGWVEGRSVGITGWLATRPASHHQKWE